MRCTASAAVLLLLVVAGLGVGAAPAAGYGGPPQAPEIAVSASVVTPGQQLAVEGMFFTPHGHAYLTLHSSPVFLASVTIDRLGTFAVDIRIPETTTTGAHTIEALDVASGDIATAIITVQRPPAGIGNGGSGGGLGSTGVAIVSLVGFGAMLVVAGAGSARLGRRRKVAA